jgi:NAD(P)-dependent dehydrogenase (short-subunit alcohol dehydrogenase family)
MEYLRLEGVIVDLQLSGRIAVVTGAASGMGRAVAVSLATEGAIVVGADLNLDGAEKTAQDLRDKGLSMRAHQLDVTSRESWQALRESVGITEGQADILCNVAGPGAKTGHLDTDDAEWHRQVSGHLDGVFLGCQTFLPDMMERRYGKIINMCSFTAHGVSASIPGYGAAFGGILAYTKDLARFVAPYNINVNCVSPGNIETAMTRDGWLDQPGALERLRENTPIGRVGQPEDVSSWFAFLASDRSQHAVGVEINVSGGQLFT